MKEIVKMSLVSIIGILLLTCVYQKKGISWSVCTSDFFTNQKKLRDCMNDTLKHLELDNPRYYRLKDEIVRKGLHNKLW